jgi:hypothetical protein
LDRVKLNGTIHADERGTYMMCGAKRVPVEVRDADGNILAHGEQVDNGSDTGTGSADDAGKDEGE